MKTGSAMLKILFHLFTDMSRDRLPEANVSRQPRPLAPSVLSLSKDRSFVLADRNKGNPSTGSGWAGSIMGMAHDRRLGPIHRDQRGFTLTELMVVIFIIGLLATVVLINVLPSQDKAMVTKAEADIATLESAMEMYRLDNLAYPGAGDGLEALRTAPASLAQADRYRRGGYIKRLPEDPWGRPYQYNVPGKAGAFDIYSLGADGAPGGDGDSADIYGKGS